jgi:hypothetical protein
MDRQLTRIDPVRGHQHPIGTLEPAVCLLLSARIRNLGLHVAATEVPPDSFVHRKAGQASANRRCVDVLRHHPDLERSSTGCRHGHEIRIFCIPLRSLARAGA